MQNPSNTTMVQFLNHTANSASELPLSFFKSGQFLCLSPDCQGGLIIHKSFYADFVGPGAAVGSSFDVNCTSVYVIGEVTFWVPPTYSERQQAFQKRMAYSQQLQELVSQGAPIQRCALILNQLSVWVGAKETNQIPDELIARLAGVFTKTVKMTRKIYTKTPAQTQVIASEGNPAIPTFCDRS